MKRLEFLLLFELEAGGGRNITHLTQITRRPLDSAWAPGAGTAASPPLGCRLESDPPVMVETEPASNTAATVPLLLGVLCVPRHISVISHPTALPVLLHPPCLPSCSTNDLNH